MKLSQLLHGCGDVQYRAAKIASLTEITYYKGDFEEIVKDQFSRSIAEGIASKLVIEKEPSDIGMHYKTEIFILTREELQTVINNVRANMLDEERRFQQLNTDDKPRQP